MVTVIITNDGLEDTIQMTTETRHTGPAREHDGWWKAWILLSGLAATVVGGMALPGVKSPADAVGVSPTVTTMSVEAMPQKPVFEAPVTRTRRS